VARREQLNLASEIETSFIIYYWASRWIFYDEFSEFPDALASSRKLREKVDSEIAIIKSVTVERRKLVKYDRGSFGNGK